MIRKIPVIIICLCCFSCTDPKGTYKTLSVNNYTEIEIGGYDFFGGKGLYKTSFRAKAPNGEYVRGAVTRGILSGSTIRLK